MTIREAGRIASAVLVTAVGVDGQRQRLGMKVAASEAQRFGTAMPHATSAARGRAA